MKDITIPEGRAHTQKSIIRLWRLTSIHVIHVYVYIVYCVYDYDDTLGPGTASAADVSSWPGVRLFSRAPSCCSQSPPRESIPGIRAHARARSPADLIKKVSCRVHPDGGDGISAFVPVFGGAGDEWRRYSFISSHSLRRTFPNDSPPTSP